MKSYSNGEPSVRFTYDNRGSGAPCPQENGDTGKLLIDSVDGGGTRRDLCYGLRGQVQHTWQDTGTEYLHFAYTYDDLGQVKSMTYPDNEVLTYAYEAPSGTVSSVTSSLNGTLATNVTSKPWGAPASMTLGTTPALTTNHEYDYRLRTKSIVTGAVQNFVLTYDAASNVKTVADATSAPETVTFGYDDLYEQWHQRWDFDRHGPSLTGRFLEMTESLAVMAAATGIVNDVPWSPQQRYHLMGAMPELQVEPPDLTDCLGCSGKSDPGVAVY